MPPQTQLSHVRRPGAVSMAAALLAAALTALLVTTALTAPRIPARAATVTPAPLLTKASRATLDYSPQTFVGGMRLTFTGNIGARGRRTIRLQMNLNRPGDRWITIDGFKRRTNRSGRFSFTYPAPSMRDKLMRVKGKGGYVTPARVFNARSQDLVLTTPDGDPLTTAEAGRPFDIRVDTTPTIQGRSDLPGPVLPGRELTLQQRVIDPARPFGYATVWQTVEGGVLTDADGVGVFHDVTEDAPGLVVYRVRQERWTRNGADVGWFGSFPTYVEVTAPDAGQRGALGRTEGATQTGTAEAGTAGAPVAARGGGSTTAGVTYGWSNAFDFGWSKGESLDSPPQRGRDPVGRWLDASEGTGRAVMHNGQLMIDSQREIQRFARSRGTTMVTMQDPTPTRLGRWEVRMRSDADRQGVLPSRARIELVPADPDDYACGARTITIADYDPIGDRVTMGVHNTAGTEWTRTIGGLDLDNVNHAWGIEVAGDHLTWFREGQPVGTITQKAAVPDVPMTVRMSIVGQGEELINKTQNYYDWVRGYTFDRGTQVRRGGSFETGRFQPPC